MTPEALDKLTLIFRTMFNQPELVLSDNLSAADVPGWDSHKHVSLVVTIEAEFGVRFANSEIAALASVGDLTQLISAKIEQA